VTPPATFLLAYPSWKKRKKDKKKKPGFGPEILAWIGEN